MPSEKARVLAASGYILAKERTGVSSSPVRSIRRVLLLQRASPLESSILTCAPTCQPYLSSCVLRNADAGRRGVSV